jgi:hypothetical protein
MRPLVELPYFFNYLSHSQNDFCKNAKRVEDTYPYAPFCRLAEAHFVPPTFSTLLHHQMMQDSLRPASLRLTDRDTSSVIHSVPEVLVLVGWVPSQPRDKLS